MIISYYTTSKSGRLRTWWLTRGVDILCPVCKWCVIPIEEVWCGCRPISRKMKKWCKGRRAAYRKPYVIKMDMAAEIRKAALEEPIFPEAKPYTGPVGIMQILNEEPFAIRQYREDAMYMYRQKTKE